MHVQKVSDLLPRPVSWLWTGRVPGGKLVLLEGDPGLGKSFVALDWCARLSRGKAFPDGAAGPAAANSLYLNGEDSAAETLKLRLETLDADAQRVFVLHAEDVVDAQLRLPSQIEELEQALSQSQARLVVIDPIAAFLDPGVQLNSDVSVRRALTPLRRLAAAQGCTILLIRHLNKNQGRHAVYRGGGSMGFLAVARAAWLVAKDSSHPGQIVLAELKSNLTAPQPSLAFTLQAASPADAATGAEAGATATPENAAAGVTGPNLSILRWLAPSARTADELLGAGLHGRPPSRRARARDFLAAFLAARPRSCPDIWNAGRAEGLSERTLRRARKDLTITIQQGWHNGQLLTYWCLDGQNLPEDVLPLSSKTPLADRFIADFNKQFPDNPLGESRAAA